MDCGCVGVRACMRACVRACVCAHASLLYVLVLCFVMGYVLQYGEMAHKRVHSYIIITVPHCVGSTLK